MALARLTVKAPQARTNFASDETQNPSTRLTQGKERFWRGECCRLLAAVAVLDEHVFGSG